MNLQEELGGTWLEAGEGGIGGVGGGFLQGKGKKPPCRPLLLLLDPRQKAWEKITGCPCILD